MINRFKESKLFFWSVELLVVAMLLFIASKINFLFAPIGTFFFNIVCPSLSSGLFVLFTKSCGQSTNEDENETNLCRLTGILITNHRISSDLINNYS